MARPRKVDTSKASVVVSEPTEDAIREELTGTDTGKYEEPQKVIAEKIDDVDFVETAPDPKVRQPVREEIKLADDAPPTGLKAPWIDDTPVEEPAKPAVQEDPYKKRYEESVQWNSRLSQDVAELKRTLDLVRSEMTKPKETPQPQYTREQLMEWRDRDPDQYYQWQAQQVVDQRAKQIEQQISSLQGAMTGILAKSEADRFAAEHQDFNDLSNDIRQELQGMPQELTTNPAYYRQALNMAYWTVKGRKNVETNNRSREAETREMASRNAVKRDIHVEGGSVKTAGEPPLDLKNASSREIFRYMQKQGLA